MLGISEWASHVTGMPDMWTALQFDNAIMVFGRWVEHEMTEGRTLRELLDIPLTPQEKRDMNRAALAGLRVLARHRGSGINVESRTRKAI